MGWADIGWRRRCKTRLSLSELDMQGTAFVFWRSPRLAIELDHFCTGGTLSPHKRDDGVTQRVYGMAPTRRTHCIPNAVSGSGRTSKYIN